MALGFRLSAVGVAAVTTAFVMQGITPPKAGGMLQPGTMLIYTSGGVETPWTIDSAAVDTTIAGRSGCVRLKLRLAPAAQQTTRAFCADSATLWTWNDSTKTLRESRPLTAGGTLSLQTRGGSVLYEAGTPTTDKIGGVNVYVIPTTVTTRDANGRIVRRLTENYSIGLLTATRGTFEVPDSTRAGEWIVTQRFELIGITGTRP
jgi:hypothetical protein